MYLQVKGERWKGASFCDDYSGKIGQVKSKELVLYSEKLFQVVSIILTMELVYRSQLILAG